MQVKPKAVVNSETKQPAGFKESLCTNQQLTNIDKNLEPVMTMTKYFTEDFKELDEQVKLMMETSQNMIQAGKEQKRAKICKVCGKEGAPTAIRDHIEAKHLDGVSLPCNTCEKTFRSRTTKRLHSCKNT